MVLVSFLRGESGALQRVIHMYVWGRAWYVHMCVCGMYDVRTQAIMYVCAQTCKHSTVVPCPERTVVFVTRTGKVQSAKVPGHVCRHTEGTLV